MQNMYPQAFKEARGNEDMHFGQKLHTQYRIALGCGPSTNDQGASLSVQGQHAAGVHGFLGPSSGGHHHLGVDRLSTRANMNLSDTPEGHGSFIRIVGGAIIQSYVNS